jgi:hypothetical protein
MTRPWVWAIWLVAAAVLVGTSAGCAGHTPPIDRAAVHYLDQEHVFPGLTGVSCDERGDPTTVRGVTYRGYMCALHGGRADGGNKAIWWDGTRVYASCTVLPRTTQNALCFD